MANRRKPEQLKALAGTARPDRHHPVVEMAPLSTPPKAPDWLPNEYAFAEWDRVVPILMANKLLTEADTTTLAHACALHGQCVAAYQAKGPEAQPPTASMLATLRNLMGDFGLSPLARGKVKPSGEPAKQNRFSANKRPGNRAT